MLVSPLPPSFLDTYGLSVGCKALHIVISFLFLWSFTLCSPVSILRMIPSILQRGELSCLSLWWDFCCRTWFREAFSFLCGTLWSLSLHTQPNTSSSSAPSPNFYPDTNIINMSYRKIETRAMHLDNLVRIKNNFRNHFFFFMGVVPLWTSSLLVGCCLFFASSSYTRLFASVFCVIEFLYAFFSFLF